MESQKIKTGERRPVQEERLPDELSKHPAPEREDAATDVSSPNSRPSL
jgi:hypothetical protein